MPLVKYFWMSSDREFLSDSDDDVWIDESGKGLKRKNFNLKYLIDGEIPGPVVMLVELFLQARARNLVKKETKVSVYG